MRWPGHVAAGATSWALAATYDIPITVVALAGATLPSDGRVFDGVDLTAVLLHGVPSPRNCVFHWHDSSLQKGGEGLSAVHCGDFKAHFSTQGDYAKEARQGKTPWPVGKQDPPLLFNLTADASETVNIDPSSAAYTEQMNIIRAARKLHLASIVPVCSQDRLPCGGSNISFAVCGDRDSKAKYPEWPECTITPAAWGAKSCV